MKVAHIFYFTVSKISARNTPRTRHYCSHRWCDRTQDVLQVYT